MPLNHLRPHVLRGLARGVVAAVLLLWGAALALASSVTPTLAQTSGNEGTIVFMEYSGGDSDTTIQVVGAGGGTTTRIATDVLHAYYPTWSPDGSKMAFTGSHIAEPNSVGSHPIYDLYVMAAPPPAPPPASPAT